MNISIKDIAKKTGYAVSTVSRVLNGKGHFSKEAETKIKQAAKEMGYQQNPLALGMKTGSLSMIAIIVPDIMNAYYAQLVETCERILFKDGYLTIVCSSDRNPDTEKRYVEKLQHGLVSGLIIISSLEAKDKFPNYDLPTVYIDRFPKLKDGIVCVASDNYQGGALAANHLIDTGTYPIMITTAGDHFSTNQKRILGFSDTCQSRGLEPNVIKMSATSEEFDLEAEREHFTAKISELLSQHERIGIFCINDNLAAFLYQEALMAGYKVPEQIAIVGFDGSAKSRELGITTIRQDIDTICDVCCSNLLSMINKSKVYDASQTIPVSLIKRKTT